MTSYTEAGDADMDGADQTSNPTAPPSWMAHCSECAGSAKLSTKEWCERCDRSGIVPRQASNICKPGELLSEERREQIVEAVINAFPASFRDASPKAIEQLVLETERACIAAVAARLMIGEVQEPENTVPAPQSTLHHE
jgi:hypothetical protein